MSTGKTEDRSPIASDEKRYGCLAGDGVINFRVMEGEVIVASIHDLAAAKRAYVFGEPDHAVNTQRGCRVRETALGPFGRRVSGPKSQDRPGANP